MQTSSGFQRVCLDWQEVKPALIAEEQSLEGLWGFRTMPISVPGHADHSFRDDPDQLIMIVVHN
jgi:hypothetical protein